MIKFDARGAWRFIGQRSRWCLVGGVLAGLLAACGGGGSAGTPVIPGNGSGGSTGGTGGTGGTTTPAYAMTLQVQRTGTSTTQISSTETVQAVATVKTSAGAPVAGVVVSFSEGGSASLLAFQPQSATALTDSSGNASVDIGAKTNTGTGATTVAAAATVAGVAVTGNQSIAIAAGTTSTVIPTPATISFTSSSAGGQAIAIKGAGGNGRAEAAILEFRVLDSTGAPINGAAVSFSLNAQNAAGATISPASAVSDSGGRVTTTVLSGTAPGSIVVVATATAAPAVKVQSDTLLVSNSVPTASGFELVAAKYNLDGSFTGDSTTLTAFVRDQYGNPVPDGVAVSFQTDYGVVAASTLGGCTTTNGTCNVSFRVQDPRGPNGLATVVASIGVGTSTALQQSRTINMAAGAYTALNASTQLPLTSVQMNACKFTVQALLKDVYGHSVAAGTVISTDLMSSDLTVTMKSGTPVADQLSATFDPLLFGFEIDATSSQRAPPCLVGGTIPALPQAYVYLGFKTPNGIVKNQQRIDIYYPQ